MYEPVRGDRRKTPGQGPGTAPERGDWDVTHVRRTRVEPDDAARPGAVGGAAGRHEEVDRPSPVRLYDDGAGIATGHPLQEIGKAAAVFVVDADGVELHACLTELESGSRNPIEVYFATLRIHKDSLGDLG